MPCKNGGQCYGLADGKSFYCSCPPTHTGPTCETGKNKCFTFDKKEIRLAFTWNTPDGKVTSKQ